MPITTRFFLVCLAAAVLAMSIRAAEAPGYAAEPGKASAGASRPLLRLELEQHAALVNALATDRNSKFAVTAANDNTIRVWSIDARAAQAGGQRAPRLFLDSVIRLPLTADGQGKALAVAITGDGRLIAAGGVLTDDASANPDAGNLWIFDRATGRTICRFQPGSKVLSVRFSQDHSTIAAGLAEGDGLKVWRIDGCEFAFPVAGFIDGVDGLDFAPNGEMAAASRDGTLKILAAGSRSPVTLKLPFSDPLRLSYSPDGRYLAVGSALSPAVAVFDRTNTAKPAEAYGDVKPSKGSDSQGFPAVAWSADGKTLFAGGSVRGKDNSLIVRAWRRSASNAFTRLEGDFSGLRLTNSIRDLAAFGNGGVLALSEDPALGAYDASGAAAGKIDRPQNDFRPLESAADRGEFRLSADGATVSVPVGDGENMSYDAQSRTIRVTQTARPDLASPKITAAGFKITGWFNGDAPEMSFADRRAPVALTLASGERARSLAIAANDAVFVLGADRSLRAVDRTGKTVWKRPMQDVPWRVNIPSGGKLVVTALGDGTLRWYRLSDGQELGALFLHADRRRWVAWTTNNKYDASVGGEDLIGWHVPQGGEKPALFFGASRFSNLFREPGVLYRTLVNGQAPAAPDASTILAGLPPIVRVISVADTAGGKLAVTFVAESPTGRPIRDLRVMVDGSLAGHTGPAGAIETGKPITVSINKLPGAGARTIVVTARHADGIYADARGFRAVSTAGAKEQPGRLFAVIVGVSQYNDPGIQPLQFADDDANAIDLALRRQEGKLYSAVKTEVLADSDATRANVAAALTRLAALPRENDTTVLFLAGHGFRASGAGGQDTFYFATHDTVSTMDRFRQTSISGADIAKFVSAAPGRKLIFLDACHSGSVYERNKGWRRDAETTTNDLANPQWGAFVWAATDGNSLAQEQKSLGHGVFTLALLEAMNGKAPEVLFEQPGRISQFDLTTWLNRRIPALTDKAQNPSSFPYGTRREVLAVVPKR